MKIRTNIKAGITGDSKTIVGGFKTLSG